VDFDPDGIGIMSTYKYGSTKLSYQKDTLIVPSIRWIGLQSADIVPSKGSDRVGLLRLSKRDRNIATRMLEREEYQDGRRGEWRTELQVMLMLNLKAEIQILSDSGMGLETWLDMKLAGALKSRQA
jgi:meiotic recombination protein SPO11